MDNITSHTIALSIEIVLVGTVTSLLIWYIMNATNPNPPLALAVGLLGVVGVSFSILSQVDSFVEKKG